MAEVYLACFRREGISVGLKSYNPRRKEGRSQIIEGRIDHWSLGFILKWNPLGNFKQKSDVANFSL